jgi:probable HAF family extracellular repeat protein
MLNHCFNVRSFIVTAALICGLGLVTHATAQEHRSFLIDLNSKTVIDLGNVEATAINDAGQVVGRFRTAEGTTHAFITGPDGVGMRDLGTLGGLGRGESYARGINDAGQVVGESSTAEGKSHAFITGPDGVGMMDLGTLGGQGYSHASGINDAGQVVGYSTAPEGAYYHAFVTGPDGIGMRDLGTLGRDSLALDINNSGRVVGYYYFPTQGDPIGEEPRGFITGPDGVGMRDLGPRFAWTINDAGQVLGESHSGSFITGPDGMGMRDLSSLGYGFDINNAGQVAGRSRGGGGGSEGASSVLVTGPNGEGIVDLNWLDLPQTLSLQAAFGINDTGQIVVIASAVPEPEAYALLLAGLGLVGFMARRKAA